jgi:hypothetical protein
VSNKIIGDIKTSTVVTTSGIHLKPTLLRQNIMFTTYQTETKSKYNKSNKAMFMNQRYFSKKENENIYQ